MEPVMVATTTEVSNAIAQQQGLQSPRNVEPDLSEVFADRGAARGVARNLHDPLSELLRHAYLPGV
jgi:hypothetical protein